MSPQRERKEQSQEEEWIVEQTDGTVDINMGLSAMERTVDIIAKVDLLRDDKWELLKVEKACKSHFFYFVREGRLLPEIMVEGIKETFFVKGVCPSVINSELIAGTEFGEAAETEVVISC